MTGMELLEPRADDTAQVWQDLGQIVREQGPEGANKPDTFCTTSVEPVESMPCVWSDFAILLCCT
jgi:hypothetical protein